MKHLSLGVKSEVVAPAHEAEVVTAGIPDAIADPAPEPTTEGSRMSTKSIGLLVVVSMGIVLSGTLTGFIGARAFRPQPTIIADTTNVEPETIAVGSVFGSADEKTFQDDAEGVILIGGFEGEGSHRLLRPGGSNQTVYLTSSVIDLNLFSNHRVKINGQTFAGQKTSWLMDVGRVEVLELNAPLPFDENE